MKEIIFYALLTCVVGAGLWGSGIFAVLFPQSLAKKIKFLARRGKRSLDADGWYFYVIDDRVNIGYYDKDFYCIEVKNSADSTYFDATVYDSRRGWLIGGKSRNKIQELIDEEVRYFHNAIDLQEREEWEELSYRYDLNDKWYEENYGGVNESV